MVLKFKRKKTSLAKLKKETAFLKRKVKSEETKLKAESEFARLKRERFKLKHRKGIKVGRAFFKGAKSGLRGARAVQLAFRRGSIITPKAKLKIKKPKRRKRKKGRGRVIIIK